MTHISAIKPITHQNLYLIKHWLLGFKGFLKRVLQITLSVITALHSWSLEANTRHSVCRSRICNYKKRNVDLNHKFTHLESFMSYKVLHHWCSNLHLLSSIVSSNALHVFPISIKYMSFHLKKNRTSDKYIAYGLLLLVCLSHNLYLQSLRDGTGNDFTGQMIPNHI